MNRATNTLPALIAHWARIVDYIDREPMTVDDYRADVDVRHEIARRMRSQSFTPETREMLTDLDTQFRTATESTDECIHGADVAAREAWTPTREWYFWRMSTKRIVTSIAES